MTESGIIVRATKTHYTVRIDPKAACAACAAKSGCGAASGVAVFYDVRRRGDYQEGDRVDIVLRQGRLMGAALLVYGLPLIGLLLGALAPDLVPPEKPVGDGVRALCAFGGMGLGLLGLALVNRWVTRRNPMWAELAEPTSISG